MLNMQNVKDIEITEGNVRTIHDKDNKLIWGRLAYDTKYAGDTVQNGTPTPSSPINVNVVTGTQTVTISDGVDSEDYTISLGTIELCKIGTYQDYIYKSGDDWYVHKECGHIQLDANIYGILQDGTAGVNEISYAGAFYVLKGSWNTAGGDYDNDAANARISSNFGEYREQTISGNGAANSMVDGTFCQRSTNDRVYMRFSTLAGKTGNEVKSMLQEQGGTNFYYYLNTPSNTQITDATLINELNNIHQFLTRYGYNSNVTGNLPIIINQTSL